MIVVRRTGNIALGISSEVAYGWALKVTAYININFDTNLQVYQTIGGRISEIHWIGSYDSLAQYEELSKKMKADAGYQELLAEAVDGCFYQPGTTDAIYASVEKV